MEYEFLCKTFRCCIDEDCDNCPLYDFEMEHCKKQIQQHALSLIIRQQAEIEKLNIDLDAMRCAANSLKMHYDKAKSEAVRDIATEYDAYKEAVEVALVETRAEAVREFAEFLIDKAENNVIRIGDLCDYVIDFNGMTEEKK